MLKDVAAGLLALLLNNILTVHSAGEHPTERMGDVLAEPLLCLNGSPNTTAIYGFFFFMNIVEPRRIPIRDLHMFYCAEEAPAVYNHACNLNSEIGNKV